MTDPEDTVSIEHDDLEEREADLTDEFDRELPDSVDEADAIDQKREVPVDDEDYDT